MYRRHRNQRCIVSIVCHAPDMYRVWYNYITYRVRDIQIVDRYITYIFYSCPEITVPFIHGHSQIGSVGKPIVQKLKVVFEQSRFQIHLFFQRSNSMEEAFLAISFIQVTWLFSLNSPIRVLCMLPIHHFHTRRWRKKNYAITNLALM